MWLIKKYREFRHSVKLFLREEIPKYFSRNRITSWLYYSFLSNDFFREYQTVLAGKAKHVVDTKELEANYFLLVRSIHRLEKGLLMRPRKKIFAKGYISEAVTSYQGILENAKSYDNNQIQWFTDVLDEYFSVVENDPIIDKQREIFLNVKKHFNTSFSIIEQKKIPYSRDINSRSHISYEEFYKLSRQRRSVRWFKEKPVPRELIDKALLAAIQAPSACNRQPFEYRIFDDREKIENVIHIPMGTRGYAHNVPALAVVVGNLDAYYFERDRHLIYIDASLANMSFMYALETLGLSSCPINWPDMEDKEKQMEEALNLEGYQRPIMLIAIGYPDHEGKVAFSEKRPLNMIRRYN